ncbi:hypothetical protein HNQ99_001018 [Rhizorhapis suberifaciens]|uniref:Uncharacterized protein n=1 Tax=Rhizorhapis suberifaciens TaxID=13656 RepID=A0A840HRY6_9SPHN|nr:hypothetical protein [Rhizorhapis suberifaciens]
MANPFNADKGYPVSLQCAAEAVFGPNEKLRRLLQQSHPEPKENRQSNAADDWRSVDKKLQPKTSGGKPRDW